MSDNRVRTVGVVLFWLGIFMVFSGGFGLGSAVATALLSR